MNDAELYKKNNGFQKRDVTICLRDYEGRIKWRGRERVADLGCGDGSTTAGLLRPFLPDDFEQLVGFDVSARMVAHARTHHSDPRTSFLQLDLGAPLPPQIRGSFDHVFSFHALHWVYDQEQAFTNIYEMLAPGGDCLFMLIAHHPWIDMIRAQAAHPDWHAYIPMHDFRAFVYHDSQEPDVEVRKMMENIGFKNISVERKVMKYVFESVDKYMNALFAINPFKIPEELRDKVKRDNVQLIRDLRMRTLCLEESAASGQSQVHMEYTVIVASAEK